MNQKAFYVGQHPYHFRVGEPAEIIGVEIAHPEGLPSRPVFRVRYKDGFEDTPPVREAIEMDCVKSEDEIALDALMRNA